MDVVPLSKDGEAGAMIAEMRSVMIRRTSVLRDIGSHFQAERLARGRAVSQVFKSRGAASSLSQTAEELA